MLTVVAGFRRSGVVVAVGCQLVSIDGATCQNIEQGEKSEKITGWLISVVVSNAWAQEPGMAKEEWLKNLRPIMSDGLCNGAGSPFKKIYKGPAAQCVPDVEKLFDKCAANVSQVIIPARLTSVAQANRYGQIMAECIAAHYMGGDALKAFFLMQDMANKEPQPAR